MALGIGLSVMVVALMVGIATRPKTFRVQRSTTMAAPPELAFAYVNNFHKWSVWSPYEHLDPNMTKTIGGAASGAGATYAWSGNNKAGTGRMAIREATPFQRIVIDLAFDKPMKSTSVSEFTFDPTSDGTRVTWAMSGDNTLMGKAFSLVVDMDKLVGKAFEQGLATLKSTVEAQASEQRATSAALN